MSSSQAVDPEEKRGDLAKEIVAVVTTLAAFATVVCALLTLLPSLALAKIFGASWKGIWAKTTAPAAFGLTGMLTYSAYFEEIDKFLNRLNESFNR